jgi:ankyrin repeat protein/acetyl esterase/lipase
MISTPARAASPLADATEQRDFASANKLLGEQADVNTTQPDGMTAVHWSVLHDNAQFVETLIAAGASVNVTNRYGVSPLSLACQNGNTAIIKMLLDAEANPAATLPGGETMLMTAARTGRLEPVALLLTHNIDVNAREHKGQTALMWAAAEGHTDVVDALLKAGADSTIQLKSGFTALFFAVREGRTAVVHRLIAAGNDVNSVMETPHTPRFSRGKLRLTPLLLAVENGHFELAKSLLEAGADPNAAPSGYTALHSLTWVRKPIRGDGDPSPQGSGTLTSLDMVRALVAAGANINARLERGRSELGRFTYGGSTPFLLAAQTADLPLMKLLVELGADASIPNEDSTTPLLAAAGVGALGDGDESAGTEQETIAAVEYLLTLGADVNAVDDNGETAMHGAAYQSLARLVPVLVSHGANSDIWNRENRAGWTPRVIAIGYRPGNFRPDPATIHAIEQAMRDSGATLPDISQLGSHQRSWSGSSNAGHPWVIKDIEYAQVNDISLRLDLHLPPHATDSRLIVWVHGGAWREGSKSDVPIQELVKDGFTVASVDYRLSTVARFPVQVHDIKAAIRFLRAISSRYRYRTDKIAIAGASAGGHLAALVGTSNGLPELEGEIGKHLDQSSDVHAIVDLFGPTNFLTILQQSTPHGLSVRVPALELLLGGQPDSHADLAKLASPVAHVDAADPPLLIFHGDQDPQVPINQSLELQGRYQSAGAKVQLEVLHGAAHGGTAFYEPQRLKMITDFLRAAIQ